jgi:UDP-glucose 4-epimerase|tara:strand:+ start:1124 stop:2083 length:960 start_codon:yes stop_codon:yes gene_type:complete
MFQGKNILVTGGAGFIGSHLCDNIWEQNPESLVILDNMSLGNLDNLQGISDFDGVTVIEGDASDYQILKDVIQTYQIDVVFNLAVIPLPASLSNPLENVKVNIDIVSNLCEMQRLGFFETLIHFSSSEAYGSAQYVPMDESHPYTISTPYAASKAAGDLIALSYKKTFNTDVTVLRPFNNYGPRQNSKEFAGIIPLSIGKMVRGETIQVHGDGQQTRDYIYVKDTVKIVLELYSKRSQIDSVVNISTGVQTSTQTILQELEASMPWDYFKLEYVPDRASNVTQHCGDNTLLSGLCDKLVLTPLAVGIKKTVEWYKNNEH